MDDYAEFLRRKELVAPATGILDIPDLHEDLFPLRGSSTA